MPSDVPPHPILPASLISDLSGCSWTGVHNNDQAGGTVGHFVNGSTVSHLALIHDATGPDAAWAVRTTLDAGIRGILFTSADATKLIGGVVQTDGSITYSSVNYRAALYSAGSEYVLKLQ